jgi:predicted transcriptional regulator
MEDVRKLRRLVRVTQHELAREARISRVRISLLENEHVEARPREQDVLLQALFAIAKRREAHIRHLAETSTALVPQESRS